MLSLVCCLDFGPFPAKVFHAPCPCALHGVSVCDALKALETIFKADMDPQRVRPSSSSRCIARGLQRVAFR